MKFGRVPIAKAKGSILAHAVNGLKKGRRLTDADIDLLQAHGLSEIVVATLDQGDVPEDVAAAKIAAAAAGNNVIAQKAFTGRANLTAAKAGLVRVDENALRKLNQVHEAITIATLRDYEIVAEGQMLATVKIIPYAAPAKSLEKVLALLGRVKLIEVAAFTPKKIGLVITKTPEMKTSLVGKTQMAISTRAKRMGSTVQQVITVPHESKMISDAITKLAEEGLSPILVFGGSAIIDRGDVVPAALKAAKGKVLHLGMPVDPGNLLMLGRRAETPVIGVPTCARSLKINGFDWVLQRLCADIDVSAKDVMGMGAGGLLAEISTRPQRRAPDEG